MNTCPYLFRRAGDAREEAYLLGVLSSLPLDWYARRYVEVHLNLHIAKGLPIPRPDESVHSKRIIEIAARLAASDARFTLWAKECSVPVGSVEDSETRLSLLSGLFEVKGERHDLVSSRVPG